MPETFAPGRDEGGHLRARSGEWLLEPELRPDYRRFARQWGTERALTMAQDPEFARHVRAVDGFGVDPIQGAQWQAARSYAAMYHYDFDSVIEETYRQLGKPLPRDVTPEPWQPSRIVTTQGRHDDSWTEPEPNRATVSPEERPSGPEALSPAEKAATRHSEAVGMPRHRKGRHSQTSKGRRERHLRAIADRDGITVAQADALHPARPRGRAS